METNSNIPLVSVVITTRNRLELLKRAVKSVKEQSYLNVEIIVVDDASEDGTNEWCESQNFRYIRIPESERRGGNYARNLGIKNSIGKYVAFLDDDDYWKKEKIEKQVTKLEETGNEVIHCHRLNEIVKEDGSVELVPFCVTDNYSGDLHNRILYQISVLTSTLMVRRDALMEVGLFDENVRFWQEYELSIRLAQRKPFDLIREPLVVYRINQSDPNRLTNKYDGWKNSVSYIYEKHKALYKRLPLLNKFRVKLLFWGDSSKRAKQAGLMTIYKKHRFFSQICLLPYRIHDKVRLILKK